VLTAALRFGEEPFLTRLRKQGLLTDEDRAKIGGHDEPPSGLIEITDAAV
jgi:hypothetical protein